MTGDRESSECSCSSIGSELGIEENAPRELQGIAPHGHSATWKFGCPWKNVYCARGIFESAIKIVEELRESSGSQRGGEI